jgi:hypothetical protein
MKGKIVLALAVSAVAVIASSPVNAGCSPASKEFSLAYSDTGNYDIFFPAGADTDVNAGIIGRLWQPGARATTSESSGGGCPDSMWVYPPSGGGSATIYGSNGSDLGNGVCDTAVCPSGGLIAVVQTKALDNSKSYYVVGRVNEGAPLAFDFGRTLSDWNAVEIPRPVVTGSSRTAASATVDVQLPGPDAAFHSPAADSQTASGTITGYQLVSFNGGADPGRDASAGWAPVGGPIASTSPTAAGVVVACPSGTSTFLGTRVIIDGFLTDYVSASTRIACSNIATPGTPNKTPKPIVNKKGISEN